MLTTRHLVDFPYTTAELQAIFRLAHAQDQALGERYGVWPAADRSEWLPAVRQWTTWWQYHDDTTGAMHGHSWEESDLMGAFLVRWGESPTVWPIEVQEAGPSRRCCGRSAAWNCRLCSMSSMARCLRRSHVDHPSPRPLSLHPPGGGCHADTQAAGRDPEAHPPRGRGLKGRGDVLVYERRPL